MNDNSQIITSFIDTIQQCYLHQHILQPTRYRRGEIPGLLDLIFTNDEGNLTHNPGLGINDHTCITFQLN